MASSVAVGRHPAAVLGEERSARSSVRPAARMLARAPRLFRKGGRTAVIDRPPRAPSRCTGFGLDRLLATRGKTPVFRKRRNSPSAAPDWRPRRAGPPSPLAGNRTSPRDAIKTTKRLTIPRRQRIKIDWMTPRVRATIRSRWEPRSVLARRERVGLHASGPPTWTETGQARSRSSNKRNANNNAAPLYNTQ